MYNLSDRGSSLSGGEMSRNQKRKLNRSDLAWRIITIAGGSVLAFCIITYIVTGLVMSRPSKDSEAASRLASVPFLQSIRIEGTNELSGYLLDVPGSDRLLIYFYGISDCAASSMEMFVDSIASDETFSGIDIAVIDWPSYGDSPGYLTDSSMKIAAADTVSAFMNTQADTQRALKSLSGAVLCDVSYSCREIIIMGYSLGTGPAVYSAAECGCDDLILLSPYYSSADLYNSVIPVFYGPLKGLLGFTIDTYEYADDVAVVPLIAASSSDTRVPVESSVALSGCFTGGCDLHVLEDIEHGSIPMNGDVLELVRNHLG